MSGALVGLGAFAGGLLSGWYLGWLNGIPGLRKRRSHLAIGVYRGPSPFELRPYPGVRNPVLTAADVTDVPSALFVAHPYVVRQDAGWYMFLEVFSKERRRGAVGLATSEDGLEWRYRGVVLREPFHLTNPYVFAWNGDYWMVPDTYEPAEVRLYRATDFPTAWEYDGPLVRGVFADPSLIRHDGRWWMFACSAPLQADTLRLFFADELTGPWREHPKSPVREGDARHARPAGRLLELGGRVIRFAQDWDPVWAKQVWAFEVTELTTETYRERPIPDRPVLTPGHEPWHRNGMSHLDARPLETGDWLAFVVGHGEEWVLQRGRLRLRPTPGALRPLLGRPHGGRLRSEAARVVAR